jgi:hypothetical protein
LTALGLLRQRETEALLRLALARPWHRSPALTAPLAPKLAMTTAKMAKGNDNERP